MEGWKTTLDNHRPVLRESAHERSDPSRYAENDFGHADLRHHWLALLSGQPVLDVVFWRCVFGFATLLVAECRAGLPAPRQPGA